MKSTLFKVTTAVALSLALLYAGVIPASVEQVSASSEKVDGYSYEQDAIDLINELNIVRRGMGLSDVILNPILTNAAQGHATYLEYNKLSNHTQDKTKPKFTGVSIKDRFEASGGVGIFNTLGTNYYAEATVHEGKNIAVRSLLAGPYHRFPMHDPYLKYIGVGLSGETVVFEYSLSYNNPSPENILYPYDGQADISINMISPESPNPLEGTGLTYKTAGYIPTAILPNTANLLTVPASMSDNKGASLSVIVKKEIKEGVYSRQGYATWLIIPKKPLDYETTYNMDVNGVKWSFSTEAKPSGGNNGGGTTNPPSGSDLIYISSTKQASKSELLALPLDPSKKFSASSAGIRINGQYVTLKPSAKVLNGSTFIPLRGVFEKLGSQVFWDQERQLISILHSGGKEIQLTIGSKNAYVDGYAFKLPQAPFVDKGTTYIPLRFVSEAIGGTVLWDQASSTVSIVAEYNK